MPRDGRGIALTDGAMPPSPRADPASGVTPAWADLSGPFRAILTAKSGPCDVVCEHAPRGQINVCTGHRPVHEHSFDIRRRGRLQSMGHLLGFAERSQD